jgi:hypothetical protein
VVKQSDAADPFALYSRGHGPSAGAVGEAHQEDQETHIQYHTLGLSFEMHHPREQSPLQCWRVNIYLTKTWDAKAGMFFLPFPGRLSKREHKCIRIA